MVEYPPWTVHSHVRINCLDCTAECCKHVAISIHEPESAEDFQAIADYLQHKGVTAYKDHEGDWLVEFKTRCGQLDGNRCMAFKDNLQPMTCREYSVDNCVMNQPGDYWEIFFASPEDVERFAKERGFSIMAQGVRNCEEECCNHISIPLDDPEGWRDFDDIRWYVAHKDVDVYKDADGDWMCRFTTPKRMPCERCRRDACAYDEDDVEIRFSSMEDVDAYLAKEKISPPKEKLKLSAY